MMVSASSGQLFLTLTLLIMACSGEGRDWFSREVNREASEAKRERDKAELFFFFVVARRSTRFK